jgi:hypothetical protein
MKGRIDGDQINGALAGLIKSLDSNDIKNARAIGNQSGPDPLPSV